jgi:hypothetical protein
VVGQSVNQSVPSRHTSATGTHHPSARLAVAPRTAPPLSFPSPGGGPAAGALWMVRVGWMECRNGVRRISKAGGLIVCGGRLQELRGSRAAPVGWQQSKHESVRRVAVAAPSIDQSPGGRLAAAARHRAARLALGALLKQRKKVGGGDSSIDRSIHTRHTNAAAATDSSTRRQCRPTSQRLCDAPALMPDLWWGLVQWWCV